MMFDEVRIINANVTSRRHFLSYIFNTNIKLWQLHRFAISDADFLPFGAAVLNYPKTPCIRIILRCSSGFTNSSGIWNTPCKISICIFSFRFSTSKIGKVHVKMHAFLMHNRTSMEQEKTVERTRNISNKSLQGKVRVTRGWLIK